MDKTVRKIKVDCKVAIGVFALGILLIICLAACGDGSNTRTVYVSQPPQVVMPQQIPIQQPQFNWLVTPDSAVRYRWLDDGSCVVLFNGQQTNIPRGMFQGSAGAVSWAWEDDGDVDVTVFNNRYDLDSPFDVDDGYDDGYVDNEPYIDDSAIMGGAGAAGVAGVASMKMGRKVKVYSYDKFGNPLDRKGRIISTVDKKGRPIRLVDSKGNPLPNNGMRSNIAQKPGMVPQGTQRLQPGMVAGHATGGFPQVSNPQASKLNAENIALRDKLKRQQAELKRQQKANSDKKLLLKQNGLKQKAANTSRTQQPARAQKR